MRACCAMPVPPRARAPAGPRRRTRGERVRCASHPPCDQAEGDLGRASAYNPREMNLPTSPPVPERIRTLIPHEHGAYGQLALPMLTALALGHPNAPALLL